MKKKKCPKCKHGNIEVFTATTVFTDYEYSEGLLSEAPPHVLIFKPVTKYQCKKCGHTWSSQGIRPFRIKVERIEPGDIVT